MFLVHNFFHVGGGGLVWAWGFPKTQILVAKKPRLEGLIFLDLGFQGSPFGLQVAFGSCDQVWVSIACRSYGEGRESNRDVLSPLGCRGCFGKLPSSYRGVERQPANFYCKQDDKISRIGYGFRGSLMTTGPSGMLTVIQPQTRGSR